jgi:release factor glutamine methyltransferase
MSSTPIPRDYLQDWTTIQDIDFKIPYGVFIPRPETEYWVLKALKQQKTEFESANSIVDLCSGTGLIGMMIAKHFPSKTILSIDINPLAIEAQHQTFQKNSITNVTTYFGNLFEALPKDSIITHWILLCNPPYVPDSDKNLIIQNNLEHEPANAIFGEGVDGLDIFYKIIDQLKDLPLPTLACFELDPRNIEIAQRYVVTNLETKSTEIINDSNGLKRVLLCRF